MLNPITATDAAHRIGKGFVYTGDPMTPGGMVALGATEGDIMVDEQYSFNDLTTPEWTGDAVHESRIQGQRCVLTIPLIMKADGSQQLKLSPTGQRGGGFGNQVEVVPTCVLVLPEDEVGNGLSWSGAAWTPAAPKWAIWIWRARITPGQMAFHHGDGGKVVREINVESLFDDTKPDGYKLYVVGDPRAVGINVNP